MKGTLVILVLVVATAFTTWRFHYKTASEQTEIDKLDIALSPVKKILPPGSSITFHPVNVKNELSFWTRYILAPRYIALYTHTYDTILMISPIANIDSARTLIKGNILWESRDSTYYYLLTNNNVHR